MILRLVDVARFGRAVRALRVRRGWRQIDLAAAAAVSRTHVGRIERGERPGLTLDAVDSVAIALGASTDLLMRWHGEGLDRLLDEAHARLVEVVVRRLRSFGWEVAVEVSFSRNGERGSIDVLAFHPAHRALVVIEVKSVTPDMQAMLGGLDRKARLGADRSPGTADGTLAVVARILVLWNTRTNRRRVEAHEPACTLFCPQGPGTSSDGSPNRPPRPFAGSGSCQMRVAWTLWASGVTVCGFAARSRAGTATQICQTPAHGRWARASCLRPAPWTPVASATGQVGYGPPRGRVTRTLLTVPAPVGN